MALRALVVEDDPSLREVATVILESAGFEVDSAADGPGALDSFRLRRFDLVLLDLMLPELDGFEVCKQIRRTSQVPIVMLTARSATSDLVRGLELGADDYVVKPFEKSELTARVRAVMRRAAVDRWGDQGPLVAGALVVDPVAVRAELGGTPLTLTATEFKLLLELLRHRGEALGREFLLRHVWGYEFLGDSRLVDVAVWRLREKLADDPKDPVFIETVRGFGYRFGGADG
jgi:two-component system response regulator MtrA